MSETAPEPAAPLPQRSPARVTVRADDDTEAGGPREPPGDPPFLWRFLLIFLGAAVFLGAIIGGFYHAESQNCIRQTLKEDRLRLNAQRDALGAQMACATSDATYLAGAETLARYLENGDEPARRALSAEFAAFATCRRAYKQVRWLDDKGIECVRVHDPDGAHAFAAAAPPAYRSAGDVLSCALRLEKGEAYVATSGFDPVSAAPVACVAAPAFDRAGRKRGVVVLDLDGTPMLETLRAGSRFTAGLTTLVNGDGSWLAPCERGMKESTGGTAASRTNLDSSFPASYPAEWEKIIQARSGQFTTGAGAFAFDTIFPAGEKTADAPAPGGQAGDGGAGWKIVSHIRPEQLCAESRRLRALLLPPAAALFLLAGLASWLVAQAGARRAADQHRLRERTLYDVLTGLPNRSLFMDRLDHVLRQSRRYRRPCALLILDIDGFKKVNDEWGQPAGDLLLKQVSDRVMASVRSSDTVGRLGGDKFTLLLTRIENPGDAVLVAEKLLKALAQPFDLQGRRASITASIGISLCPADSDWAEALLSLADRAMHEAKRAGHNGWHMADPKAAAAS